MSDSATGSVLRMVSRFEYTPQLIARCSLASHFAHSWPLYANMALSTKPEVAYIRLQRRPRRTEPRPD